MKPSLAITNDGPALAGRHIAEAPGFDESGQPTATVDFDYPDDEPAQPEREGSADVLHLLKSGLLVVIDQGNSALTTAAALAYLLELFPTKAAAASAVGCNRSTMLRAVRRMQKRLASCNVTPACLGNRNGTKTAPR